MFVLVVDRLDCFVVCVLSLAAVVLFFALQCAAELIVCCLFVVYCLLEKEHQASQRLSKSAVQVKGKPRGLSWHG